MGLFNNYMKPGKGVSKDEPEKKGFFLFWDVLFHRFSNILGSNCLLTILSLIWIVLLVMAGIQFVLPTVPQAVSSVVATMGSEDPDAAAASLVLTIYAMFATTAFAFIGSGPASAAYAYIAKCFTNRQHAWVLSDSFDKFKENFKQAIVVVLIDIVAVIVIPIGIRFYSTMSSDNVLFAVPCYLMIVFTIIYIWMHFYIYQLMVTFECSLKQLYKNALIFALGKLPMNIFLTIVCGGVSILPYAFLGNPLLAAILATVIGLCFTRFLIEFYAARCMKQTILNAQQKPEAEPEAEEEAVFDDNLAVKIKNSEEKK